MIFQKKISVKSLIHEINEELAGKLAIGAGKPSDDAAEADKSDELNKISVSDRKREILALLDIAQKEETKIKLEKQSTQKEKTNIKLEEQSIKKAKEAEKQIIAGSFASNVNFLKALKDLLASKRIGCLSITQSSGESFNLEICGGKMTSVAGSLSEREKDGTKTLWRLICIQAGSLEFKEGSLKYSSEEANIKSSDSDFIVNHISEMIGGAS